MVTWLLVALGIVALLAAAAVWDMVQTKHAILRVYPLVGRLRYLLEKVGPELRQYIVTDDLAERPYFRAQRSWAYRAAKGVDSAVGFGTQQDLAQPGQYHFLPSPFPVLHSEAPADPEPHVVGPHRPRPFVTRARVGIAPGLRYLPVDDWAACHGLSPPASARRGPPPPSLRPGTRSGPPGCGRPR